MELAERHGCDVKPGMLDGFLLLEASGARHPRNATAARLVGKKLRSIERGDLELFTRLSTLDVSDNNLEDVAGFSVIGSLQELRMAGNKVQDILWKCEVPFRSLLVLDLSHNQLSNSALISLTQISKLRELDLTCCGTKRIPSEFKQLVGLEVLVLASNSIAIVDPLGDLPNLRELDLSSNKVHSVRNRLENKFFPSLEWLSLKGNKIRSLDDLTSLNSCQNLSQVILFDNPISKLDRKSVLSNDNQQGKRHVNIVSETPKARTRRKSMYSNVRIRKIDEFGHDGLHWKSRRRELLALDNSSDADREVCVTENAGHDGFFLTEESNEPEKEDEIQQAGLTEVPNFEGLSKEEMLQMIESEASSSLPINSACPSIQHATSALRFALNHPLTSHLRLEMIQLRSKQQHKK